MRNRFKGLDLIECPKNYGQRFLTLYWRQWSRPSPRKKKCKKAKWLSEEALLIAVKRREAKSTGEKERYTHLNAEFQRIARRDKKVFLSDQCKEIEENNRMGKTRSLFKKIRDTKGNISSFIVPIFAWNVPLVSLIFLKRSLVFPILLFSSIYLHWSLRKAFLTLLAIL